MKNPQSTGWKALGWTLVLAAAAGYVVLNLAVFDIPFDVPGVVSRAAVVATADCGAAGFLMLNETRRNQVPKGDRQ